MGAPFTCNSEIRWPELHPTQEGGTSFSSPPSPTCHGPRNFKGFCFFLPFCLPVLFPLKLPFCDCSFHCPFTPLSAHIQNNNPFAFGGWRGQRRPAQQLSVSRASRRLDPRGRLCLAGCSPPAPRHSLCLHLAFCISLHLLLHRGHLIHHGNLLQLSASPPKKAK